jgi:hypothetical protein
MFVVFVALLVIFQITRRQKADQRDQQDTTAHTPAWQVGK